MPLLGAKRVLPIDAQVALVDRTWQDYPQWEPGGEAVAYRAPSLIHPDEPPYPGFAVATRADVENGELQHVDVELWAADRPEGLYLVHSSVLAVGSHGIEVGSVEGGAVFTVDVPRGAYPIEIWTDGSDDGKPRRVAFVLPTLTP